MPALRQARFEWFDWFERFDFGVIRSRIPFKLSHVQTFKHNIRKKL